jgi:hypothetical protein
MANEKQDFKVFSEHARILVYFSEGMSSAEIDEHLNEWYAMYKESSWEWPSQFIKEHFSGITRDSHNFWLDDRGVWLMEVASK